MNEKRTTFNTKIGPVMLAWTDKGISKVKLPNTPALQISPDTKEERPPQWVSLAAEKIKKHLDGEPQQYDDVPLDLQEVTPFNKKVYEALRRLPSGAVITYGDLAARAGSRGAARAVGHAMAVNPLPIVVPCHRVVRSDGTLGQFSALSGTKSKRQLLEMEGCTFEES